MLLNGIIYWQQRRSTIFLFLCVRWEEQHLTRINSSFRCPCNSCANSAPFEFPWCQKITLVKRLKLCLAARPAKQAPLDKLETNRQRQQFFPFFFLFFLHFRTGFVEEKNVDFETKERRRANCGETHGTGHRWDDGEELTFSSECFLLFYSWKKNSYSVGKMGGYISFSWRFLKRRKKKEKKKRKAREKRGRRFKGHVTYNDARGRTSSGGFEC